MASDASGTSFSRMARRRRGSKDSSCWVMPSQLDEPGGQMGADLAETSDEVRAGHVVHRGIDDYAINERKLLERGNGFG